MQLGAPRNRKQPGGKKKKKSWGSEGDKGAVVELTVRGRTVGGLR